MPLDIDKYRRAIQPTNIFELLPRPILEQMVRGYFYRIRKGVTLLWSEYDSHQQRFVVCENRVDPFHYSNPEDRQFYNEVCWEYRVNCGDANCHACNRRIAQEYSDGKSSEVEVYPCWLGLDDLAYPLRIGKLVRAVLFAGQIVPDDDARIEAIEEEIGRHARAPLDDKLIELLHEERRKQWGGDPQYAQTLKRRLGEFGDMIQQIITRLYEARREAVTRELLQSCEDELASVDLDDPEAWWRACEGLLADFAGLVEIEEVHLYARSRNRYERRVPKSTVPSGLLARDVLSAIPAGRLQRASGDEGTRRLATKLGLSASMPWFYVSHAAHAEGTPLSTFLVLRGKLGEEYGALTAAFCRIVSQSADFFSLVGHQRLAQQEYRDTVAQVAHDFRTPLQVLLFDLEAVGRLEAVRNDPVLRGRVQGSVTRAMGAQEHVERLLGTADEEKDPVDINLRAPGEEYHRYLTTADAYLPVAK